jgi:hypothetical protein
MFAYEIGNRLQSVMISDTGTICPDVADVEQLFGLFAGATLVGRPATSVSGHDQ